MAYIKKCFCTVVLSALFTVVLVFYNIYALNLADNFLYEKTEGRRLMVDLICDVAEHGDDRQALIEAINEIDSSGNRGTYAAVFDADLDILTVRSPYFKTMNFNPFNFPDFTREVKINNRGRISLISEFLPEASAHTINMYFRWVYRDSETPMLVIVGVSKYAVETDIDGGLKIGAWIIASAFTITGITSVIVALRKKTRSKKGGAGNE